MRVVVFGATGGTGRELVKQALGHGHDVRAFVRSADRLKAVHHRLEVVQGDVLDTKPVAEAIAGTDAVLSALGVSERKPNTILSDGVKNILGGMKKQKVKRLIFVSSLGVGDTKGQLGPLYNWILLPGLLKHAFADKEKAEELIRATKLDWTLVRPGSLNNKLLTGTYRVGPDAAKKRWFPRIARADVADFMLNAVERDTFVRESPSLTY